MAWTGIGLPHGMDAVLDDAVAAVRAELFTAAVRVSPTSVSRETAQNALPSAWEGRFGRSHGLPGCI